MSLDRMFRVVKELEETASADATFGEPVEAEGKVLISVAETSRGFGMTFDEQIAKETAGDLPSDEQDQVGAAGAGAARPVAMIEVTSDETVIRPIVDEAKVALAGIALIGWVVFWLVAAVRSVFAGRHESA